MALIYVCVFQLYQTYGKRKPEDVHAILVGYNTSYIIMEDSICLAPSKDGCRLPDLIDVDNGVVRLYEPRHVKTEFLLRRKQRCRSASQ